mgnify:FL=1
MLVSFSVDEEEFMNNCKYNQGKDCPILRKKCCAGCKFAKSHKQYNSEISKTNKRLARLSAAEQMYISEKYYNGDAPWKNK